MNDPNLLLQFQLFQGMSTEDIEQILKNFNLRRLTLSKNKLLFREGESCDTLFLLVNGKLKAVTYAQNHSYHVTEILRPPYSLQPESLFGLWQHFTQDVFTADSTELISIDKAEVRKLADQYLVFRLNLLNLLATRIQKLQRQIWWSQTLSTRQRIIQFIRQHISYPAGEKSIKITMQQLADEIHKSRLNVSRELNKMQQEEIISISRGVINIPAIELLLNG